MSGYSDIIRELSRTVPLNSGAAWISEKIIAGQYSSISISYASDQDITLLTSFSNDGIHFDINITKTFSAGTGYENLVILGKFMRLTVTNIGIVAQTYLRIYTYGATTNTSLNAIISKVGNYNPEISVDNLPLSAFGELKVEEDSKEYAFIFTYGTSGQISNNSWRYPNTDLKAYSASAAARIDFTNSTIGIVGGESQQGVPAMIYSNPTQYLAGTGVCFRGTAKFTNAQRNINAQGYQYQLFGIGNLSIPNISDGFFFGNVDTVSSTYQFGIHHFRGGVKTTYLQSVWNVDKADGTGILPAIDFLNKYNVFQIQYQYLGAGDIYFYIENPATGQFRLVHIIKYSNSASQSSLLNPSMGLVMYSRTDSTGAPIFTDTDRLESISVSIAIEGSSNRLFDLSSVSVSKFGVSGTFNLIHLANTTTFYGLTNRLPIKIENISLSTDGTKNVGFKLLKGAVMTSPLFTNVNSNITPMVYDISGILFTQGDQQLGIELMKTDRLFVDMTPFKLTIHPGENLVLMASTTASNDVKASLTFIS